MRTRSRHPRHELRAQRERRGWTFSELAKHVPASKSFLFNVEKGVAEPRELALVVAFEELFGIPVETWPNFSALRRLLEIRKVAA